MAPTFFDLAIATIVFEPRDLIRLPVPPNFSLPDLLPTTPNKSNVHISQQQRMISVILQFTEPLTVLQTNEKWCPHKFENLIRSSQSHKFLD